MHDHYQTIASQARVMLDGIGPGEETSVRSASLKMVLQAYLELVGQLPSPLPRALPRPTRDEMEKGSRRSVAGVIAQIDEAVESSRGWFEGGEDGRL